MSKFSFLRRLTFPAIATIVCSVMMAPVARGDTITTGLTFTVSEYNFILLDDATLVFRSNSTSIPPNKAEVGLFTIPPNPAFPNVVVRSRGLSEFNLAGLTPGPATLTFDVFLQGGLTGEPPGAFDITIIAYQGNNAESTFDFLAPTLGTVGSFDTAGLMVGQSLSFDVTSLYNSALAGGFSSFGIRLQGPLPTTFPPPFVGNHTFDNFRLSTPTAVPEPVAVLLLGTGLAGIAAKVRGRPKARRG